MGLQARNLVVQDVEEGLAAEVHTEVDPAEEGPAEVDQTEVGPAEEGQTEVDLTEKDRTEVGFAAVVDVLLDPDLELQG
nr:hypothetical protein BaRGS_013303 [Batillaria attramentaria]